MAHLTEHLNFYPRSPCGERLDTSKDIIKTTRNFYPRSPCGERLINTYHRIFGGGISIHALLAESDASSPRERQEQRDFYPRSPCGERPVDGYLEFIKSSFLSTLSLRRATVHYDNYNLHCVISIHALLAESDTTDMRQRLIEFGFLSTLSLRRATGKSTKLAGRKLVFLSTLSLRRATYLGAGKSCDVRHFYPRSPCGERLAGRKLVKADTGISIHALLAESDGFGPARLASCVNFYPRSPCGERLPMYRLKSGTVAISIHALLAESDRIRQGNKLQNGNFYPRSPCGERR